MGKPYLPPTPVTRDERLHGVVVCITRLRKKIRSLPRSPLRKIVDELAEEVIFLADAAKEKCDGEEKETG